ncbi:MAG TPA: flagellar hook basal-body protein [Terriglobia bacterium]|nr:flagellar hook basal-body protein [Terriglobia bacterium]
MNSGFYAAFAGLRAKSDALDVAANNLANTSTPGYKAQREFYRSLMASMQDRPLSSLNSAINNFGVLGGTVPDLQQGMLEASGNDLDLGLEGAGFFAVQTPAGVRYTRNGAFHLSESGVLVNADGYPVLGEQGPGKQAPIEIVGAPVSVGSDGTISVGDVVSGRLWLVDVREGASLLPEGSSYFAAEAKDLRPAANVRVRQGFLEASNMNPVTGAVDLILLQRHAEMLMRAVSIFYTEFNQIATQDLARV